MPMAIPLLAAAGTAMAGYGAMTAVGATLASQVIGGVMIAGSAMTAVGAITGNSRLMRIGGVVSLAGGAAGLVNGAWETAATKAAESSFTDGAAEAFRSQAAAEASNAAAQAATAAPQLTSSELASQPFMTPDAAAAQAAAPGVASQTAGQAAAQTAGQTAVQPAVPTAPATAIKPVANIPTTDGNGIMSSVKGAIKWATATPENSRLVQGGLGILSAGLSAYGQQEAVKEQLAMQAEQRQRAIDRLNESVKGVRSMPVYVRPGS